MKIAVVGTGISGLVAAYLLHGDHELTVFEANDYVGGHTRTIDVKAANTSWPVDTGFIVFNEKNYPNFVRLLRRLNVPWQQSTMSFSVRRESDGLEYRPTNLDTLFAQRRNLLRPSFWRMLRHIFVFRRRSRELLDSKESVTLGQYLARGRYSRAFVDLFLIPMGAAIWSADPARFQDFPARTFARFFHNHGFLQVRDQPQWQVIRGGSRQYVEALIAPFQDRIRLQCPVRAIRRLDDRVELHAADSAPEQYDQVIIAAHSDQALGMLADPTPQEREVLGAIPYQRNTTVLHRDASLLPRLRKVWASWNYLIPSETLGQVAVTYHMNTLQSLDAPVEFCVTLNQTERIDPQTVEVELPDAHPVFNRAALAAQQRFDTISGVNGTHFCGAYWGYGFHEDGVNSALAVCRAFGKEL
jgi:predicted NAD/FAD-binding protein